ncbi:TauD/TfdA family dioxygenase [Myxococcota bacterium]|nr:TauD/TfdA family dioxygenase [Myxococcota bacterium]
MSSLEVRPEVLETHCEWRMGDMADAAVWTEELTPPELEELDAALRQSLARSDDVLSLGRDDFPLPTLGVRLSRIERELIDGRGFVLLRGLPRERYDQREMEVLYWGIGMHLGEPWPQNARGHVLGDVTDQGRAADDPNARGNELGGMALEYHSDGSDLVGLMCLDAGLSGGVSRVANAVAIHNDLVREAPDLAAALYHPQPFDFRGEQAAGTKGWYQLPVFTRWGEQLFVRYIRPYILASQRHEDAPRLGEADREALTRVFDMARSGDYSVSMALEPGDIQFVNNYHVLHARDAYQDDRARGHVRHLKRLWLATGVLDSRPPHFQRATSGHWEQRRSVSRIPVVDA